MADDYPRDKTSNWNNASEIAMKNIGTMCILYKKKHLESARFCNTMHTILTYLGIILGPLAGLLSALSINNSISISIISFISGLIVSIIKVGRFEKNALLHNSSSSNYTNLEHNIRRQLCLYRKDRINPIQYCEWVSKSFDDIYKSSPVIKIPDKKLDISIQIAHEMASFKSKDSKPIQEKDEPRSLDPKITSNFYEVMPETPSNKSIESKITSNFLEDITKVSIVIPDDTPSNFQEDISKTPEDILVNTYTDKMMEYEMKRMKL